MVISRRKLALSVAAVTGLVCLLTSCTGSPSSPSSSASDASGPLRILLTTPDNADEQPIIQADINDFSSQTGIAVDLQFMPFDQMRTVMQTQLMSGSAPDVFQYSPGPAFSGAFAKAGLLADLTDAYASRGWTTYPFATTQMGYDGKDFGVPLQIDEIGLFYNKDLFTQYGLQPPTSLDELTSTCAALKAKGVIPIAVSDQEGWEGGHLLSMALGSRVGGDKIGQYFTPQADWGSDDVVGAIQTWIDLNNAGCLNPSPTGTQYADANALFTSGQAAMTPTGSWQISNFQNAASFTVGLTPFPSPTAGAGVFSTGVGNGLLVSASTKHMDAALKLLDWYQTAAHAKLTIEQRSLIPPLPVDTSTLQVSPLMADLLQRTADVASTGGGFGQNIDVLSTDAFNQAMYDGMQAALSGQKTAQQVANDLKTAFASGQ